MSISSADSVTLHLLLGTILVVNISCDIINTTDIPQQWTNLVLDSIHNKLFAAGEHTIKVYSANLTVLNETDTSVNNKILLVDSLRNRLITCGTPQGNIVTRSIEDLNILSESHRNFTCNSSQSEATVAFIGKTDAGYTSTMYVGNSLDKNSINSFELKTLYYNGIFSLNLEGDKSFDFSSCKYVRSRFPGDQCSAMSLDILKHITVTYIDGFIVQDFAYFFKFQIWNQTVNETIIARICQEDKNYFNSYVEMPMTCGGSKTLRAVTLIVADDKLSLKFNIQRGPVLVTAFENPYNASESILCLSSLEDISKKFDENKRSCSTKDYFYQPENINCSQEIPNNFCGGLANSSRTTTIGEITFAARSQINVTYNVTSILGYNGENTAILILGTSNGYLLRTDLNAKDVGINGIKSLYSKDNSPVKSLILSKSADFVFWRTTKFLFRVELAQCSDFKTCEGCMQPINPLCGWCTMMASCNRRSECSNSLLEKRWIPSHGRTSDCPVLLVDELDLEVTINKTITIEGKNLPQLTNEERLECLFSLNSGSNAPPSPAAILDSTVSCQVPSNLLDQNNSSLNGNFTLIDSTNQTNLFKKKFYIYRCTMPQALGLGCDECLKNQKCFFSNETYSCTVIYNAIRTCPRVKGEPISIHTGNIRSLSFELQDFQDYKADNLRCWITKLNITLPAKKANSQYECSPYNFTTSSESETLKIFIVFGVKNILSGYLSVEVYNCKEIGKDDCSLCKSKGVKYGKLNCTWCDGECGYQSHCPANREDQCPFASISEVHPLIGAKEGGTRLTVLGKNLGSAADQVRVAIQDITCITMPDLYIASRKFVCKTPSAPVGMIFCNISLHIDGTAAYLATFQYKEVKVGGVFPNAGPKSGGTRVTISGGNLFMSQQTYVAVHANNASLVVNKTQSNSSQIVFITQAGAGVEQTLNFQLQVDNFNRSLDAFTYLDDPQMNLSDTFVTFKRARCNAMLIGRNLNVSSSPFLTFVGCGEQTVLIFPINYTHAEVQLPIFDVNCTGMTANFYFDGWNKSMNVTFLTEPKFEVDNTEESSVLLKLTDDEFTVKQAESTAVLSYSKDPSFVFPFEMKINGVTCNVSGNSKGFVCGSDGRPQEEVEVRLCSLTYKVIVRPFPVWQTALGVCVGILVAILLVMCIVFLIKYFESQRKYENLMSELDHMEKEARVQMKEAFAKLQTADGHTATGEGFNSAPFNSYRIFAYRVLYSKERDHPVLHTKKRMEKYERKMQCLTQLLNSKFFLLNFTKVLEKKIHIDEKSKIGSYLGLFLLDKMDYAAEVITALLGDRIENFVSSGKNLKLMMRSGDSVVERVMCYWLTLSMYKHLTGSVGQSLFEMIVAVKKQVCSGPVDVCTSEAKFTLSEGFFLKNYKFDDDAVVVTVNNSENLPTSCTLLACDAVSQAKDKVHEKYFEGVPYHLRIPLQKFDLLWQRSPDDVVRLLDEEGGVDPITGTIQIRTVESYDVRTGAILILQRRSSGTEEGDVQILGDETLALSSGSSSLSPISLKTPERRWHLVNKADLDGSRSRRKIFFTEMYYPLLQTKVALEENINKLFKEILIVTETLPPSVKYLFNFFDDTIEGKGINDPDITKSWKRDSFMLRVWVNLIQNPYFLLDVPRNTVVDINLSVVGQALIDSCSQEKKLSKDSPTSTLLFAKNHKEYGRLVGNFYETIKSQPRMSEAHFLKTMESNYSRDIDFNVDFNLEMVLAELYEFARKYKEEIMVALDEDESAKNLRLVHKFQHLFNLE